MTTINRTSFLLASAFALAGAIACSSSTNTNESSTNPTTPAKTCANLQKCCDKATEPTKSACNTATAQKNESFCSVSYDAMCGSAGGDAGPEGGAQAVTDCTAACAKSNAASCALAGNCQRNCEESFAEASSKRCASEWSDARRCLATATYTCNDQQEPVSSDCQGEALALYNCMK